MIKVLIVDDSFFMRKTLKRMLEGERDIQVVGLAENGEVALEKIQQLKPDVVTLDIEMPVMNGIETLKQIMAENPVPVIVVSALTKEGAEVTVEALSLGACDFVTKDVSNLSLGLEEKRLELLSKIREVAKKKTLVVLKAIKEKGITPSRRTPTKHEIVSIGASTGGPSAIQFIVASLPADFPCPIVIAQHMPRFFTYAFSERLRALSSVYVKEAEDGDSLRPGVVFIAPGGAHMRVKKRGGSHFLELFQDSNSVYKPSVNHLMLSCAEIFGRATLGIILTGMGNDGLEGARSIKAKGGTVLVQDEETSVVYGMPKAVVRENLADLVLPIQEIPKALMEVL